MKTLKTYSAKSLAQAVLKRYWDRELPVNVRDIAKKLGINVIKDYLDGASGEFYLSDSGPVIKVEASHPEVRKRFTIAHECGHFVLAHGDSFRDTQRELSASNYNPREVAANRFAAEILMPERAIEIAIEGGMEDIKDLADLFFVSEPAMAYRLKNLGWIH